MNFFSNGIDDSIKVLNVLFEHRNQKMFGSDIAKQSKVPTGTVFPLLGQFTRDKWVKASNEDIDSEKEKRQPRRQYQITDKGSKYRNNCLRSQLDPELVCVS